MSTKAKNIQFFFFFLGERRERVNKKVLIWDGGGMEAVVEDSGEMVEQWWGRSNFQIGDLGFIKIWIGGRGCTHKREGERCEKNWVLF